MQSCRKRQWSWGGRPQLTPYGCFSVEFKTARWFNAAVVEQFMAGVTATSKRVGPVVQMTGCHVTVKQAAVL